MDNKYLCLFDENGRRGETHLSCEYSEEQKQEMLEAGYVEISQDEWDIYVGNKGMGDNGTGYVRGKDGKPISAPAHVPSKDEKLAVLDSQYDADKAELTRYFKELFFRWWKEPWHLNTMMLSGRRRRQTLRKS